MKSDVIRIAICDDEKVIAEKIKKYVEDYRITLYNRYLPVRRRIYPVEKCNDRI